MHIMEFLLTQSFVTLSPFDPFIIIIIIIIIISYKEFCCFRIIIIRPFSSKLNFASCLFIYLSVCLPVCLFVCLL